MTGDSILDQLNAMLGWSIQLYDEVREWTNFKRMIKLARLINTQGRRLEWRGSGLKRYPDMKEVDELKLHVREARAAVESVLDFVQLGEGLTQTKKKLAGKRKSYDDVERKAAKVSKKAVEFAPVVIESLKQAIALEKSEPWYNVKSLARKENRSALLDLLYQREFYASVKGSYQFGDIFANVEVPLDGVHLKGITIASTPGQVLKINLTGSTLKKVTFEGSFDLIGEGLEAHGCSFGNVMNGKLSKAKLTDCEVKRWSQVDCIGATLKNVTFKDLREDCIFAGAELAKVTIFGELNRVNFEKCDLRMVRFVNKKFRMTNFSQCDMSGMDFSNSYFTNCTLKGANLAGASLVKGHIQYTDISGANIKDADIAGLDLFSLKGFTIKQALTAKNIHLANGRSAALDKALAKRKKDQIGGLQLAQGSEGDLAIAEEGGDLTLTKKKKKKWQFWK